jgi:signal transduction histidine kinase
MSGPALLELVLAVALVTSLGFVAVLLVHARRLAARLRSLTTPAHELRGALAALQLGIDAADRRARAAPAFAGRTEGLRMQLDRANLAIAGLDRARHAKAPSTPPRERLDLAAIVLRSVRAWSQLAPGYGAGLDFDWRAGPLSIRGDADRLKRALDNLIANALEHGGGRVLLEGELRGACVRLTISDGGSGLAAADSIESPSRSARGHGLAIARDAIEADGGRLRTGVGANGPGLMVELPVEATRASMAGSAGVRPRAA